MGLKMEYQDRCPDCYEEGGNGARCFQHEREYINLQIESLRKKRKEITENFNQIRKLGEDKDDSR